MPETTAPAPAPAPMTSRFRYYVGAASTAVGPELRDAWCESTAGGPEEREAAERIAAETGLEVEVLRFGAFDGRGREIGAEVATWRGDGAYFMKVQATRGGEHYQAMQPARRFETAEARASALAEYLKGARKRANDRQAADARARGRR